MKSVPANQPTDAFTTALRAGLLSRVAFYWGLTLVYFIAVMFISFWMDTPQGTAFPEVAMAWVSDVALWLPACIVILPLAVVDFARFLRHIPFSAPAFQVQLKALAAGEPGQPIDMPSDQFGHDVAVAFNQVREELLRLRAESARRKDLPPVRDLPGMGIPGMAARRPAEKNPSV